MTGSPVTTVQIQLALTDEVPRCGACLNSRMPPSSNDFEEFEPAFPYSQDATHKEWQHALKSIRDAPVSIREAQPTGTDGRRMKDMQFSCEPITVQAVAKNVDLIDEHTVLFAEQNGVHVGFCLIVDDRQAQSPLFIQVVAVVPEAQRQGIGMQLMEAAASIAPTRNIAFATQDENAAARALNERFATSLQANLRKVRLGTFPNRSLGIQRSDGYRSWLIERSNQ